MFCVNFHLPFLYQPPGSSGGVFVVGSAGDEIPTGSQRNRDGPQSGVLAGVPLPGQGKMASLLMFTLLRSFSFLFYPYFVLQPQAQVLHNLHG